MLTVSSAVALDKGDFFSFLTDLYPHRHAIKIKSFYKNPSNRYLTFSELPPGIAEIFPVSISQNREISWAPAKRAVDKDLATFSAAEIENSEVWLKLEFERTYSIHTVTIHSRFFTDWYDPSDGCVQNDIKYQVGLY